MVRSVRSDYDYNNKGRIQDLPKEADHGKPATDVWERNPSDVQVGVSGIKTPKTGSFFIHFHTKERPNVKDFNKSNLRSAVLFQKPMNYVSVKRDNQLLLVNGGGVATLSAHTWIRQ